MVSNNKIKLKEILKNKKFLIAAGIVAAISLIAFYFKNKSTTTETPSISADESSYGGGGSSGSYFPSVSRSEDNYDDVLIDTGLNDDNQMINNIIVVDDNQKLQEVSNKIYDYKELWSKTKNEFGENIDKDEQKILDSIHQDALKEAEKVGLKDISKDSSGNYQGILSDTRKFNSITGESKVVGVEKITTNEIIDRRAKANQEIIQLKNKYALTTDKTEKAKIHQQAEEIGIKAGLGAGGADGSKRAVN